MATTTRSRLRVLLARATGFFFSGTTTGLAADALTVVDTAIQRYNTATLANKWIHIIDGAQAGVDRRIVSVASSTITITPAFAAAIASGVAYEILEYDPLYYHEALQDAGLAVPLYLPIQDETLVVDNLISNWDFETYTSPSFASWTNKGQVAVIPETSRRVHGSNSARIVPAGVDTGIEQNIIGAAGGGRQIDQMVGKTLHVRGWVLASAASAARLRVTFNGTTYTNSPYHVGLDEWEDPSLQLIDAVIPASPSEMTVSFETALDTGIYYCDVVVAWIDPIARYTLPTTFYPNGPSALEQQYALAEPNGLYLPVTQYNKPKAGHILRLTGMGRLTVPTTDAGTVELDENEAELLVAQAAEFLYRRLTSIGPGDKAEHRIHELQWHERAERLKAQPGIGKKYMSAQKRDVWRVLNDSGTRRLILEDR